MFRGHAGAKSPPRVSGKRRRCVPACAGHPSGCLRFKRARAKARRRVRPSSGNRRRVAGPAASQDRPPHLGRRRKFAGKKNFWWTDNQRAASEEIARFDGDSILRAAWIIDALSRERWRRTWAKVCPEQGARDAFQRCPAVRWPFRRQHLSFTPATACAAAVTWSDAAGRRDFAR